MNDDLLVLGSIIAGTVIHHSRLSCAAVFIREPNPLSGVGREGDTWVVPQGNPCDQNSKDTIPIRPTTN